MARAISKIIVLLMMLAVLPGAAFADSPVTSTPFSNAYSDIDIVKESQGLSTITGEVADYLKSGDHPIDTKAALINALYNADAWDTRNNTEIYSNYLYGKPLKDLDLNSLGGEELFCLGYLLLLDDYFHPEKSLPLLEKAREKIPDSFTVAIIISIARSQKELFGEGNDSCWQNTEKILKDTTLKRDLRPEAIDIIVDYMSLYKVEDSTANLPQNTIEVINEGIRVKVNGTFIPTDPPPVIVNGRVLVPVRAILESIGAKVTWDNDLQQTYAVKENISLILTLNKDRAVLNGRAIQLDTPPVLIDSRVMVPLRFVGESFGCEVIWVDNSRLPDTMAAD